MNITEEKHSHRYRDQTSGYQWGEGRGEGQYRSRGYRPVCNKKKKTTGIYYTDGEYSQYFIIALNGVKSIKILNHCSIHLKLT